VASDAHASVRDGLGLAACPAPECAAADAIRTQQIPSSRHRPVTTPARTIIDLILAREEPSYIVRATPGRDRPGADNAGEAARHGTASQVKQSRD
jgi:hypothetical protein